MADFERRLGNAVMAKVVNTLGGLSRDLNSDGVKSVKRSYTKNEMYQAMLPISAGYGVKVQRLFPFPHIIITGSARP